MTPELPGLTLRSGTTSPAEAPPAAQVAPALETAPLHAESEQRLRLVYEAIACGVVVWDASYQVLHVNRAAEDVLGISAAEVLGRPLDSRVEFRREDGSDLPREERPARSASRSGRPVRKVTLRVTRPDGEHRWLQVDAVPVLGPSGEVQQVVSSFIDVSARKRLERALERLALHDALTGLPNRTLLADRLHQAILASDRDGRPVALLLLDLDRFKEVNDSLGHPAGDQLLRQVGARLRAALRASDTVARLGGDEFAALLPSVRDATAAGLAARKLLDTLQEPFFVDGHSLDVAASIGLALYPEHGRDGEALLRHADVAMYVAKRAASGYALYAPEQDHDTADRLALVGELRRAIERDELLLEYQPRLDLQTRTCVGVEALVRWRHPRLGVVPPDRFIPLAEQTGLIRALTLWVLDAALRQCRAWRAAGLGLRVAVNLSMRDLHDPALPAQVAACLARWDVPPQALIVELTESAIMADPARTQENLAHLREMGVEIAVDDFGTGYSSLAYLHQLAVDEIKVDKAFVREVVVDPNNYAVVRATIELARALGRGVVAEGVEDRAALELLRSLGCDGAQGFYISRPLPAEAVPAWLASSPWAQ